jgi:hypothetical protein
MITLSIIFGIACGLVAAGLIIGFILTAAAPLGYQDDDGFHYGPLEAEKEIPLAMPEPKTA